MKHILSTILVFAVCFGIYAQQDTMFLYKGLDVSKIAVEDVDSINFKLTERTTPALPGVVSFRSPKVTKIGNLIWSDIVSSTACYKVGYNGGTSGNFIADCRTTENGVDLFSWQAVNTHKDALCPDGWRVPTKDDFVALDVALGGPANTAAQRDKYLSEWGAEYAGEVAVNWNNAGVIEFFNQGFSACYWSQSTFMTTTSYFLSIYKEPYSAMSTLIRPDNNAEQNVAFQVRCVKDYVDPIVHVESIVLNKTVDTVPVNQSSQLTATVEPNTATDQNITWHSSNPDVATIAPSGLITPVAEGHVTMIAISADGGKFAICNVLIEEAEEVPFPGEVSFVSNTTWKVGSQEWSDAVKASNCLKATYNGGNSSDGYLADCRNNDANLAFGDWFSWKAIDSFAAQLCPDGWNVPTLADYNTLNSVLTTAALYNAQWAPQLGGQLPSNSNTPAYVSIQARYWMADEAADNTKASFLYFRTSTGGRTDQFDSKENGNQLRCVRSVLGTVGFTSDDITTVGNQEWSEAVTATGCQKEEYDGGNSTDGYKADCRMSEGYGDLFSWEAVTQYKDLLCPNGWRVPTFADYTTLNTALSSNQNNYYSQWNPKNGGYCYYNSMAGAVQLVQVGAQAQYWMSETELTATTGRYLYLRSSTVRIDIGQDKSYGLQVRCVRDKE